ncbi:class A beta-lactamase-related serine hydrolase [Halioglobus maricola]|uniref:Class A beta-lactamase-related serine hydrolase n=1 Tax=Halioglobus maricola TaxID=2601894 RepID=A0A5P9NLE8_9GAMM|nr:serine hydrolase domain-containing protein [Halioglobus maricola]QFU76335.1 class A beta-lactamase-related serine hydrolase [Halioglobus maricola]
MTQSLRALMAAPLLILATACSDSSDRDNTAPEPPPAPPAYDFAAVDDRMQQFVDEAADFDGVSYILVDAEWGVIHRAAFGDHTEDLITQLASGSKVPAVSLLMALDGDEGLDFGISEPIGPYLPWDGLFADRTVEQLVSNTSGMPGLTTILADTATYWDLACQFFPTGTLQECAERIYITEVPGIVPPSTEYNYGGSQWQVAGAVAEIVSNSTWAQAFDAYIAQPCELEVMEFGNPWSDFESFDGSPDSLIGRDNPNIEGGAISNLDDVAKLMMMHLNDGLCGDSQVLAPGAAAFMREDRGGEFGTPYGMGWFIDVPEDGSAPTLFTDPGLFGHTTWIDIERGIGGFVAVDTYSIGTSGPVRELVEAEIIAAVAAEVDRARAEQE